MNDMENNNQDLFGNQTAPQSGTGEVSDIPVSSNDEGSSVTDDLQDDSSTMSSYCNPDAQVQQDKKIECADESTEEPLQQPTATAQGNVDASASPFLDAPPAVSYQQMNAQAAYSQQAQFTDAKKTKKSKGKAIFVALAGILLVCVAAIFAITLSRSGTSNGNNSLSDVPEISAVSSADYEEEGLSAAEIYQKTFKSCVSVLAYKEDSGELNILGSGVICQEDEQGKYTYIATCAHVINDADYNVKIETWDGKVYTAEVVNFDDTNDIGVVRIAASGLQVAQFGDSSELQPGATVYALGTPYSSKFAGTFTRGMVSAVNRLVTTKTSYQLSCIQHDAPINNGNSGGALFNAYGQVVGINALKISASGYEGLGFAVPSQTVIKVVNSIIETGIAPKTPKLGISYVQAIYYSQFLAEFIEENNYPGGAIVVAEITKDSSLYDTQLQVNDIIIGVNGQELTTPDVLVQIIQNANVGDTLTLSVIRIIMNEDNTDYVDVKSFEVTAALTEKTNESESSQSQYDGYEDFYEYFGDDSGDYEDFYDYFYDYFYGGGNSYGQNDTPEGDNRFTIPEK